MRISDWSSDVCSSDLTELTPAPEDARYRAAFPESGGSLHFRKFLETEVIPFIEARYRTGERRAVMGESLAGLFVIDRSEEHTSELQSLMRISYAVFCLQKKTDKQVVKTYVDTNHTAQEYQECNVRRHTTH